MSSVLRVHVYRYYLNFVVYFYFYVEFFDQSEYSSVPILFENFFVKIKIEKRISIRLCCFVLSRFRFCVSCGEIILSDARLSVTNRISFCDSYVKIVNNSVVSYTHNLSIIIPWKSAPEGSYPR